MVATDESYDVYISKSLGTICKATVLSPPSKGMPIANNIKVLKLQHAYTRTDEPSN